MRRLLPALLLLLAITAVACGDETITAGGDLLPTPAPAPTLAGELTEIEEPEFAAQAVMIGVTADEAVEVKALPGLDQPAAGEVPPGASITLMGQTLETEDGLVWWQVQAGNVQGWIQPRVAYRGPGEIVSADVLTALGPDTLYGSAEEAARAAATFVGSTQGSADVSIVSVDESDRGATVTADLLGDGDDSVAGLRLVVALTGGDDVWNIGTVTQFPLCWRGVSGNGLCS